MKKKLSLFLILISVGLLTALAAGPVFGGEDGLEKADAARQKHTAALLAKPGVVAVAVGFNPAGEAAVKVYTEDAEVGGIPTKLDGVPVHKQVSGKILALSPGTAPGLAPSAVDTTVRFDRPVPIGVSTGHPDITACTIGARLTDGTDVFALSNNHCYAASNNADIGDPAIQPGTIDGGLSPADDIGTLADFEPIIFGNFGKCLMKGDLSQCNYMDAAIASTTTTMVGNSTPDDGYGTPNSTVAGATVGMSVLKYGRTTGLQSGTVDSVNAAVRVGYSSGTATYRDQIVIIPGSFSAGGDSGSLIVTNDGNNNPVGLLFAGSSTTTIASPIHYVLTRFSVTIDDSASTPPATGTISGTVTETGGTTGISEATVEVDGTAMSGITNGSGVYSINDVPVGDYSLTATADGFMPANQNTTVANGGTATEDFSLAAMPTGTISGTVTNLDGSGGIGGATVVVEGTSLSETTDVNGHYLIGNVPVDTYNVTASAGGFGSVTADNIGVTNGGNNTVDFSLDAVTTAADVMVDAITYTGTGGKNSDKHLNITVALLDNLGNPVSGASVSIDLKRDGPTIASGTGTTGTGGTVTWVLNNAASGCYTTDVTDVTADGLTRVGGTPANSFAHNDPDPCP